MAQLKAPEKKGQGVPALQRSGGTSNKARLHRCASAVPDPFVFSKVHKVPRSRPAEALPDQLLCFAAGAVGDLGDEIDGNRGPVKDHPSQRHALHPLSCASSPWPWA